MRRIILTALALFICGCVHSEQKKSCELSAIQGAYQFNKVEKIAGSVLSTHEDFENSSVVIAKSKFTMKGHNFSSANYEFQSIPVRREGEIDPPQSVIRNGIGVSRMEVCLVDVSDNRQNSIRIEVLSPSEIVYTFDGMAFFFTKDK